MNKKFLIPAIAIGIILIGGIVYLLTMGGSPRMSDKLPDHEFENWDQPIDNSGQLTEEAFGMFDDPSQLTYAKLIDAAKTGQISLVSELWKLRRSCPPEMNRYDCNIRIRLFLKEKFPSPGGDHLVDLLNKFLTYEETMTEFRMPDGLDYKERYELMKKKRREVFGGEDAELVFGLEEAKFDMQQDYREFIVDTKGLSGDEKMKKFEEMRKKTMGPYYQATVEREPKFSVFEREMFFREDDMTKLDAVARTEETHSVRVKYFGEAGAGRMAAVDQDIARETEAVKNYEAAQAEFLKNNSGVPDAEKEKKLAELRVKFLGPEEAEAYARRQKYAEEMAKLNKQ